MSDTEKPKGKPTRRGMYSEHIDVRLTRKQRDAIVDKARRAGAQPSSWMRIQILPLVDWNPDTDEEWQEQLRMERSK